MSQNRTDRPFLTAGPRFSLPKNQPICSFLFYAAATALGTAGAFGCLFTAFEIPLELPPVLLLGTAFVLLCTLQWSLKKFRWAASLGTLALWGLGIWRLFPALAQGAIRVANILLAAYSQRVNFEFPVIPLPVGAVTDRQYSITLFALFLLFPFIWLLSRQLIRRRGALGAFCLTGLVLLIPLGFSILPAVWALGTLLLFWAFLLLTAPSLRRRRLTDDKGRVHTPGEIFARPASLLLVPALALFLLAVYRFFPPETYVRPQVADQIRDGITRAVNLPALIRGGTGSGGNSVDLRSLGGRAFTGQTALQVRHDWQDPTFTNLGSPTRQKDYLKSFVGSVYTGGSWERLPPEAAAEAHTPFEGSGVRAQTLYGALAQSFFYEGDIHSGYLVSVRKIDVDPRSVFSPYGLYGSDSILQGMEYADDGYVRSDSWFTGPQQYALPAVALPESGSWMFSRLYYGLQMTWRDQLAAGVWSVAEEELPAWRGLYTDLMAHNAEDSSQSALDLWPIPDYALEALPADQASLVAGTQDYTRFVYEHYTQLPDSTRAFARQYLSEHGLSPDLPATDRAFIIERVRQMLASECFYTLSPPAVPGDRDFVEYFLAESQEGFCVHFASAAVALLRACGIPARYAEGYAVPVRISNNSPEGEWIDVPDYNAHAWAEVYWGGSGWLPVEVTPPGPDAPAAYANASSPSSGEELAPTPTPSPTPRPTAAPSAEPGASPTPVPGQPTPTPTPAPGSPERRAEDSRNAALGLLAGILLALSPFLLLALIRVIRLRVRQMRFRNPDRNRAALRVYAHLLRLYEANNSLPYGGFQPPEEIEELALRARFSQHTLSREELWQMLDLATQLEQRLDEKLSPWQRRKCKYLLALF